MSKGIAQDIVPARAVAATSAQQRVVPFAIHDSTAKGTVATTKEQVSSDTPLHLNDKLHRPHGQAIDKRGNRAKEVSRTLRRLRTQLHRIRSPHSTCVKVSAKGVVVEARRQTLVSERSLGTKSKPLGARGNALVESNDGGEQFRPVNSEASEGRDALQSGLRKG